MSPYKSKSEEIWQCWEILCISTVYVAGKKDIAFVDYSGASQIINLLLMTLIVKLISLII